MLKTVLMIINLLSAVSVKNIHIDDKKRTDPSQKMRRVSWSYSSKQTVQKVTPQTSRKSIYNGRLLIKEQFPCMWGLGSSGRALSSGVNARILNKTLTKRVVISNSHKRVGKARVFLHSHDNHGGPEQVRTKQAQAKDIPHFAVAYFLIP